MQSVKGVLLSAALLMVASTLANAADEPRPYTEGPVVRVSYIKTKPGMFDAYMKWVATDRKALMEEYKKAGIIVDYRVYSAEPRAASEPDVILTVTYKNFAALDGLEDRQDTVSSKLIPTRQKGNEMAIAREQLREVLGSETIRELVLK